MKKLILSIVIVLLLSTTVLANTESSFWSTAKEYVHKAGSAVYGFFKPVVFMIGHSLAVF